MDIKKKCFLAISCILLYIGAGILTECQKQTDVEDKSYILSMYVDKREGRKKDQYEFTLAKADLNQMETGKGEIPCKTIVIQADSLKEMEEKFKKLEPGDLEWNHISTIFLGAGFQKKTEEAMLALLREWEEDWQKSPDVLLACSKIEAKELYGLESMTPGAEGQVVRKLVEQNESSLADNFARTPMDVIRQKEEERYPILVSTVDFQKNQEDTEYLEVLLEMF